MKKIHISMIMLCCLILCFPITGFAAESNKILPITVNADRTVAYENQKQIPIDKIIVNETNVDSFKENQKFVFTVKNKPVTANVSANFYMIFEQEGVVETSDDTLMVESKIEDGKLIVTIKDNDPSKQESFTITNILLKQNVERTALRTYSLYVATESDVELTPVIDNFLEIEEYVEPAEKKPLDIVIRLNDNYLLVNGTEKSLRVPAYLSGAGYTMLPLREVTEVFPNTKVEWDDEYKTASILYGDKYVSIASGANEMYINGIKNLLKNKAEIMDGRMFVSLRDICNICDISDSEIQWDKTTKTVTISTEVYK
ncbi:copper amine oxidase N-terminal domain-containing protein [Anaerotignum lactatifermentans]|uniref:copper amine oxidase N-terminal domain-containing protein n=1 Tax=Anaerotignum lactatifermentans TaxID=160404 RepID=UPI00242CC21A|nr:copper amine oxidase N-terminal domain-containing protein [Anaerotignum lactatifermentans]